MSARERHSKHLYRAALVLAGLVTAIIAARVLLTPESFGQFGFYRGDNVAEQRALPAHHGWHGACDSCHEEQAQARAGGAHRAVPCETCHAPLATHVA